MHGMLSVEQDDGKKKREIKEEFHNIDLRSMMT